MKPEEAQIIATIGQVVEAPVVQKDPKALPSGYAQVWGGTPIDEEYKNSEDRLHGDRQPTFGIAREKPEHRLILYMKLQGLSNKTIAERMGRTQMHISELCRQPWFRLRLIEEMKRAGRDGLQSLMATEGENSFNTLVELRDSKDSPAAVRKAAADSILDRLMGKPVQKTETRITTVSTPETVAELDREIEQLQEEARRLVGGNN